MSGFDRMNKLALMTILQTPGIGNKRARELVDVFGSAEDVLKAPAGEIDASTSLNLGRARELVKEAKSFDKAEKIYDATLKCDSNIITLWDSVYPARMKDIDDPPLILFVKGEISQLFDYSIAIVGTRTPSDHGRKITTRLAGELAQSGVTVVSGMALGIDSEAHLGSLKAGGKTIAVLGSGIDVIYPPSNKRLYQEISQQGAVFSEYAPGITPEKNHFPQRNRIISGLSLGVVVVEAGAKSGALITARLAASQGREVFAVPGAAGLPRSMGVNKLLKEGEAHMVESGGEIIEYLRSQLAPVLNVRASLTLPKLDREEKVVYEMLENGALGVDELIRRSRINAVDMNRLLTSMQLKGLLRRLPGARVSRA